jgi:hypothetical protein
MNALALLLMACQVDVAPLATVERAVAHPGVERFAITARAEMAWVGQTASEEGVVRVAPVADSDRMLPDRITMWIASPAGDDPALWAARVHSRFDGQAGTWPVVGRASEPPWSEAIEDAVERHGLQTHPEAVVIALEP